MHFWQSKAPNNVNAWSILSVKCLKQTLTNFFAECIHSAFCSIPPCPSFPPLAQVKAGMHGLLAKEVDLSRVEAADIPGPSIHLPNIEMQSLWKSWFKKAVTSFSFITSKLCSSYQHQAASSDLLMPFRNKLEYWAFSWISWACSWAPNHNLL